MECGGVDEQTDSFDESLSLVVRSRRQLVGLIVTDEG